MPIYEYECPSCDKVFEVQQRMIDDPLKTCPDCQSEVKKLVSVSSFQLKGGGWYADGYSSSTGGKGEKSPPAEKKETSTAPPCKKEGAPCASCPAAA